MTVKNRSGKTSGKVDEDILQIIDAADDANLDAAFALAAAAGIVGKENNLTRRILELAVERIRDSKPDHFRKQVKNIILPSYDDQSLAKIVDANSVGRKASSISNVVSLHLRETVKANQKISAEVKLAKTILDQWTVNGKRLGDATRFDLEKERDSDASIANGLNQNVRFYQSIIDRMDEGMSVRSCLTIEEVNLLRESAYNG